MQATLANRTIFCGDNIDVLRGINSETIDLIYLDPPFNTGKEFTAAKGTIAEGANFKDYFTVEDVEREWIDSIAFYYPGMQEYIESVSGMCRLSSK